MAFHVTDNHDIIRNWIERHRGRPAVLRGATDTLNSLSIQFAPSPGLEPISWEEFFDMFETSRLLFRYNPKAKPGDEGFAFNFISRETLPPFDERDMLLPEDNETLRDNMFPSAANDHGQEGFKVEQE